MNRNIFIRILSFAMFVLPAHAATENLDEVMSRKTRLPSASWSYTYLENGTTHYWQPETLNYSDAVTSNEVWRFTYAPRDRNYTKDISTTHWSANGNRVMFGTTRINSIESVGGADNHTWFVGNTDGSKLRPGIGLSTTWENWSPYPAWNPAFADVAYMTSSTSGYRQNMYKNTIGDSSITKVLAFSISNGAPRLTTKKSIASDGSKLYFFSGGTAYVANLADNTLGTPSTGYSRQLNFDYYWGKSPATWADYHDEFVAGSTNGVDGLWSYIMPESTDGSWWRARLTGTGTSNAPSHTSDQISPYLWSGEVEPVSTVTTSENKKDPWCLDSDVNTDCMAYMSHFTPDRWGRYGISAKASSSPYGVSIADLRNHKYKVAAFSGLAGIQHLDWEAWSDWSVASGAAVTTDYLNHKIVTQNVNNSASQKVLASAHIKYNSGGTSGPYDALARPTQSPDGTKAMFNSTFLNATDNDIQLFWTVAYYPYPPEIKSVVKNGSNVRLTWDFNQGSLCSNNSQTTPRTGPTPNLTTPRTYATRGWPHETLDCPPSPREIKQFRVWTSDDNATWSPVGTTTYNNCNGTNECGMWAETAWTYDYAQANSTTRYYAVTSLEHSGLESRTLSNVWKVAVDANGNITQQIQQSGYPTNPGGKSSFYTTSPPSVTPQFTHKQAPATANGQYVVKWNAPANASMIRFYNIYAKDGSSPFTNDTPLADRQKSRIASIPASSDYSGTGSFSYIDWLGATDGSTKYIVTAVDYQGNETLNVGAPEPVKGFMKALP